MARTDAQDIFQLDETTKAKLAEIKGGVIERLQKAALSMRLKSQKYSGDPTSGSVEYDRFKNSQSKTYGTARTAGDGDALVDDTVTLNIDTHKEIIETVELLDAQLYGVDGVMERRAADHHLTMAADLDRAFFTAAVAAATEVTPTSTTIQQVMDEIVRALTTTVNDFVDGIDKSMITLVLSPKAYDKLHDFINVIRSQNTNGEEEFVEVYHGVKVEENMRQTADVLCMVNDTIGQPVVITEYAPEKLALSKKYAVPIFYDYGTKVLTPDLVKKITILNVTDPTVNVNVTNTAEAPVNTKEVTE
jgi:hypothetical protein